MGLLDAEQDDLELLKAEDEAILAALREDEPVQTIPTGSELAKLIESLSNGPTTLHEG